MIARAILGMAAAGAAMATAPAVAKEMRAGGKLLLTRGVTTVEGAAGGGLASWALIAGDETDAGVGGTANLTYVALPDFDLTAFGGAIGFRDRVELSYQHHDFDTRAAGAALGLGRGFTFSQDIYGVKLRLVGDAIYDQDRALPQIAVGIQHKRASRGAVIAAVGGRHDSGTDVYVSATKLFLAQSVLANATVRWTKANQFGLLGFGGDKSAKYTAQFEGSAALMLKRNLVIGAEYRTRPDNLGFAREQDAIDAFAAFAIHRRATLTAAYVDLGDIATVRKQRGLFAQLQVGF